MMADLSQTNFFVKKKILINLNLKDDPLNNLIFSVYQKFLQKKSVAYQMKKILHSNLN